MTQDSGTFQVTYQFWQEMTQRGERLRRFRDWCPDNDFPLRKFLHGLETIQLAVDEAEDNMRARALSAMADKLEDATVLSPEGEEAQLKLVED